MLVIKVRGTERKCDGYTARNEPYLVIIEGNYIIEKRNNRVYISGNQIYTIKHRWYGRYDWGGLGYLESIKDNMVLGRIYHRGEIRRYGFCESKYRIEKLNDFSEYLKNIEEVISVD